MKGGKLRLLRKVFTYFGNCSDATRLRWGRALGWLTRKLLRSRVHIVRTNLALCFPERPAKEREALLRRHFHLLAQSYIDRGLCWFGEASHILDTVQITGLEHLDKLLNEQRRVIMLAPHFIGIDAAGTRITLHLKRVASMYTPQSDRDVDTLVREGRCRFSDVTMVNRRDGVRGMIRLLRKNIPIYYLPDMDFGAKGSVFVPFFGVPAATLLATAQIAQTWQAAVVPVISRLDPKTGRYQAEMLPPIADFPGQDTLEEATARINRLIETWILRDPAQYYWVHRRFKTRPNNEKRFY